MADLTKIFRSLFPKGWAFKLWPDTNFRNFVDALSEEPKRIKTFYDLVRDSGIPSLTMPEDCLNEWETFLGLRYDSSLTATERRQRIIVKFTANGGQGIDSIQDYFHAAGFDVYITENIYGIDPRLVPGLIIFGPRVYYTRKLYTSTLGGITLGQTTLGAFSDIVIAERVFGIPSDPNTWGFFWLLSGIGGFGDYVDIPANRENDFRALVNLLKPAHTCVIAQVNFVTDT